MFLLSYSCLGRGLVDEIKSNPDTAIPRYRELAADFRVKSLSLHEIRIVREIDESELMSMMRPDQHYLRISFWIFLPSGFRLRIIPASTAPS